MSPRPPPRSKRLPSQRASKEVRKEEAEETQKKLDAEYWQHYANQCKHMRNITVKQYSETVKEVATLKEFRFKVLEDGVDALKIDDAAMEAAARRVAQRELEDKLKAESELELPYNLVRVNWRGKHPIQVSDDDPVPAGCRVYRRAVPLAVVERALPDLEKQAKESEDSRPITAGQKDGKRRQVTLAPDEHVELTLALLKALHEAKELKGRMRSELNVLQSEPQCKSQKLHWDFDPGLIQGRGRRATKPASVILALQAGTRLFVRDEEADETVAVALAPGDALVFDGDVAHAGAWYASLNTRAHLYLDVPGLAREADVTWFKRGVP